MGNQSPKKTNINGGDNSENKEKKENKEINQEDKKDNIKLNLGNDNKDTINAVAKASLYLNPNNKEFQEELSKNLFKLIQNDSDPSIDNKPIKVFSTSEEEEISLILNNVIDITKKNDNEDLKYLNEYEKKRLDISMLLDACENQVSKK